MRYRIAGTGSALPTRVVANAEVGALARVDPGRIVRLFDVQERRWARSIDRADPVHGESCSDLAATAARRAIAQAQLAPEQVDAVVAVSSTPDAAVPPLDYLVLSKLGIRHGIGVSLQAPCTGFFRAVLIAQGLIQSGRSRTVLIVCAETISPFFRFDRAVSDEHRLNTCLFADGAGAIVMTATGDALVGIDHLFIETTGDGARPGVSFPGMSSAYPPNADRLAGSDYLGYHDFRTVLSRGSDLCKQAAEQIFTLSQTTPADFDWVITHQATGSIRRIGQEMGIPPEKLAVNIDRVGNTISASIPLLLDEVSRAGDLGAGDRVLFVTAESSTWSYAGMMVTWG